MVVSLNSIVQMISDRVGQPFNSALQEELKIIINYKMKDFYRKSINNDNSQRKYFQRGFTAKLEEVENKECPDILKSCGVLRTIKPIPKPLRTRGMLFDFVGSLDGTNSIGYALPEQITFLKESKYTGSKPKYFYIDGHIYILNSFPGRGISVRGLFLNPRELKEFKCNDGSLCYTDDDTIEIPEDLLNSVVRDILSVELRNIFPQTEEVEVDDDKDS